MAVEYVFTKSPVDIGRLNEEIAEAGISTPLVFSTWNEPDQLYITFDSALSSGDHTIVAAVVSTHGGEAIPWPADLPTFGAVPRDQIVLSNGEESTYWGNDNFLNLSDTPTTYSGASRMPLIGNSSETGVVFDLIPETAISGTYFVSYEGGRLLQGATGNRPDLVYIGPIAGLAFDQAKTESCYGSFKIPYSWHSNTEIELKINFMTDDAQVGVTTCAWRLSFQSYVVGETYGSKTLTILDADSVLPSSAVAGTFLTETLMVPYDDVNNPLTIGDTVVFQFFREGLDPGDDMFGDSILISLSFEMKTGDRSSLAG